MEILYKLCQVLPSSNNASNGQVYNTFSADAVISCSMCFQSCRAWEDSLVSVQLFSSGT